MSSRMWTDRSVVYVVRTGGDFCPRSPWDFPESFTDARIQVRNIPVEDARAMVRGLNKAAIESWDANHEGWNRQWAIAVVCVRSKGLDRMITVRSANVGKPFFAVAKSNTSNNTDAGLAESIPVEGGAS